MARLERVKAQVVPPGHVVYMWAAHSLGDDARQIARDLGVAPSTVTRHLGRPGSVDFVAVSRMTELLGVLQSIRALGCLQEHTTSL
jgi:DNA-binding MarR family transcriptional regulator